MPIVRDAESLVLTSVGAGSALEYTLRASVHVTQKPAWDSTQVTHPLLLLGGGDATGT